MAIKGGYILQPRKIDDSDIAKSPPHVREIWMYLLRKANHRDRKVNGKVIKRGQALTSYRQILEDLSWYVGARKESYARHHCETAMKALTKATMVTTTKTTRGMIVTILNYDYYQNPKNYDTYNETDNDTAPIATGKPHYKQELKNVKNEKNLTPPLTPPENFKPKKTPKAAIKHEYTDDFLEVWAYYPKKVDKAAAFDSWRNLNGTRPKTNEIIQAIKENKRYNPQWQKDGGRYIPNLSTWLNNKRWEDEVKPNIDDDVPFA